MGLFGGPGGYGQIEPKLGVAFTGSNLWLAQVPRAHRTMHVGWHTDSKLTISEMETGRRFIIYGSGDAEEGRPGRLRPGCESGLWRREGDRRAVMDFWGRLHGFPQVRGSEGGHPWVVTTHSFGYQTTSNRYRTAIDWA
jgi:hypothetical protein